MDIAFESAVSAYITIDGKHKKVDKVYKTVNGIWKLVHEGFDRSILIDFEYTKNADGTYELTAWKGTLNGVASNELVIPNNRLISLGVV